MFFAPRGAVRALLGLLLCVVSGPAAAEILTLDSALQRAAERSAAIAAEARGVDAAERHAESLSLPVPYTLGADLENFAGTGALSGTDALETTVRLGRVVELGGKRAARTAVGGAELLRQRDALERRRVDVASEVKRRFYSVLEHQEHAEIARRNAEALERVRDTVARWVEAGRNSEADLLQADIALLRAQLTVEDETHELESARVALAALWGEQSPRFERAAGDLRALPEVPAFDALVAQLPRSLDQRAFDFEARSLDAQRRLADAGRVPDLSLSVGVRRLQAVRDQALVFGMSMPLGTARRAALETDRLAAQRAAIDDRREAARLDAYQRLFALREELEHERHVVAMHREQMIPKAEAALALTRRAYEAGRSNFLLLAQAQQVLADLHTAQIEAAARFHLLLVDVERLSADGAATP